MCRFKKASDIPQGAKFAVERPFGRPIATGEVVVAVPPQKIPAFGNRALRVARRDLSGRVLVSGEYGHPFGSG
jgi:hypothetical protein